MKQREFFDIFKDIKHRILEEEHELKELLEDQLILQTTLQAVASSKKPNPINYVNTYIKN
jgi:hypothetical protein